MWRSSSRSRPLPPRLVSSQRAAGRSGERRTPKRCRGSRLRSWSRRSCGVPEAGADGLGEVALRDEVAVGVDGQRQLRQRPPGRPATRPRAVAAGRTSTGGTGRPARCASSRYCGDGAAGVRAHARVGDEALRAPALAPRLRLEVAVRRSAAAPPASWPRRSPPSGNATRKPPAARASLVDRLAVDGDQPAALAPARGEQAVAAATGPARRAARPG